MPSVNTNAAKSEKTKARRETLATKQQAEAEMIWNVDSNSFP